jgi:hypothetical protein
VELFDAGRPGDTPVTLDQPLRIVAKGKRLMRNRTVLLLVALSLAGSAVAASQRTFVASYGLDTHSCSLTQPCRQFARALTQTVSGGEIIVLDSAGYGAVDIAQDVSIVAPPVIYAGISVFAGGKGVSIHPGATNVKLRGLTINGQGGATGIFSNAGDIVIDIADCDISGMLADGLWIIGNPKLSIRDSRFVNNANYGIQYAGDFAGTGVVSLERFVARGNGGGMLMQLATGSINASTFEGNATVGIFSYLSYLNVRDTIVTNNASNGVLAYDGYLRVERSTLSVNGGWGVRLENTAQGWLVDNAIFDNQQASMGTSQVCACDAGTSGYVSGNAVHGTVNKAFEGVGPIYTFGDNRTVKLLTGSINPVSPQ